MNPLLLAPTTLPNAGPLEYLAAAAEAGFQQIGLRLNRSPGMPFTPVLGDASRVRDVTRAVAEAGLEIFDIYSFYLEPGTRLSEFLPALDLAAELRAKYIVVMGADEDWSRTCDHFASLCDSAAERNLGCVLECAVMRPLASLAQALRLIAEADRPNTGVCIDPLNFHRAGDRASELATVDPKYLPYAQMTDGLVGPDEPNPAMLGRMGPNERRLIGEGMVPLDEILSVLPEGLPLSIELPPADSSIPAGEWAKVTLENSRRYLEGYYQRRSRRSARDLT